MKLPLINEMETALEKELNRILSFWSNKMVDNVHGGFFGHADHQGAPTPGAEKGIILNSRILWSFSAAYNFSKKPGYLHLAKRAYDYLVNYFLDKQHGGVYWSLNHEGYPVNKRKQIYAQAFMIYALTEYYRATRKKSVLNLAIGIYSLVEKHSRDKETGGYIEAFGEKWDYLEDVRLSDKDDNQKKTMNTHLHVLEAYTHLYLTWKNEKLQNDLSALIGVFFDHIIDFKTGHLNLFFDDHWKLMSKKHSYGHEIETSWLLHEAALALGDRSTIEKTKNTAKLMTDAALEGMDADGGLMNEKDLSENHLDSDKHWWPQAEAMVGFLNTYQLTHNIGYWQHLVSSFNFIFKNIIDTTYGEWHWRVNRDGLPYTEEKVGFWKCPYHNTRACIEVLKRINGMLK